MGLVADLLLSWGIPLAVKKINQDKYPDGSPPYEYEPGALAASASVTITPDTQFPNSRTYGHLNSIVVINNDVVDIDVIINGKETYYCPAGVITPISGDLGIRQLTITNLDAGTAATAGAIVCRLRKAPRTMDDVARGL